MDIIEYSTPDLRRRLKAIVAKALRAGVLVKPRVCSWCGDDTARIEGHHPDYARPLMVVWICVTCHRGHHRVTERERLVFVGSPALRHPRKNIAHVTK